MHDCLAEVHVHAVVGRHGWHRPGHDDRGVAAVVLCAHNRLEVAVFIIELQRAALDGRALRLRRVGNRVELVLDVGKIGREAVELGLDTHVIFSVRLICRVDVFFSG